jgi:ubiquinone biosynthesis monooxygenase Coq7
MEMNLPDYLGFVAFVQHSRARLSKNGFAQVIIDDRSIRENEGRILAISDRAIDVVDRFLRVLFVPPVASRALPEPAPGPSSPLVPAEQRHAAGLMRVNHVGEVCAQALYAGQAVATRDPALRRVFEDAGREEGDHLAWTATRLRQLGARPSLLNPAWYVGAFALGWLAGKAGDAVSLGFVVETERQVEAHLAGHLETLPEQDAASRAIVAAMKDDEAAHGRRAQEAGAAPLPAPVTAVMRGAAKVMTTTAYWI